MDQKPKSRAKTPAWIRSLPGIVAMPMGHKGPMPLSPADQVWCAYRLRQQGVASDVITATLGNKYL